MLEAMADGLSELRELPAGLAEAEAARFSGAGVKTARVSGAAAEAARFSGAAAETARFSGAAAETARVSGAAAVAAVLSKAGPAMDSRAYRWLLDLASLNSASDVRAFFSRSKILSWRSRQIFAMSEVDCIRNESFCLAPREQWEI
jgi:hypothetical protein